MRQNSLSAIHTGACLTPSILAVYPWVTVATQGSSADSHRGERVVTGVGRQRSAGHWVRPLVLALFVWTDVL